MMMMMMMMKSQKIRFVGQVAYRGDIQNVQKILVRKPGGKETTWKT
jgi:hypothetical protein